MDEYEGVTTDLQIEKDKYKKILSQKKSSEVRLGQISENILPLTQAFSHYDRKKLVGIWNPIDLIYFGENGIEFIELKTGESKLSPKQKQIKRLVEAKEIKFVTYRSGIGGINVE